MSISTKEELMISHKSLIHTQWCRKQIYIVGQTVYRKPKMSTYCTIARPYHTAKRLLYIREFLHALLILQVRQSTVAFQQKRSQGTTAAPAEVGPGTLLSGIDALRWREVNQRLLLGSWVITMTKVIY